MIKFDNAIEAGITTVALDLGGIYSPIKSSSIKICIAKRFCWELNPGSYQTPKPDWSEHMFGIETSKRVNSIFLFYTFSFKS